MEAMKKPGKAGVTALIFFLKTQGKSRGYTEGYRVDAGKADGQPFKTGSAPVVQVPLEERIEQTMKLLMELAAKRGEVELTEASE
jgi:hypothetical protein